MSTDEDAKWLEWVTKQFETIAGDDKEIDLEEFKTALKVKESFFAERFFALFDSDGSGSISLDELLKAFNLLIHGSDTDKLRFLFQVYDVDGSGSIDPDELRTVLKSCLLENAISLPEEKLDDLTLVLFQSADKDNSGSITFQELKEELERFPEVMENLTISAANWLKPPTLKKKTHTPRYLTRAYWHNNRSKVLFMFSYGCVNILLFTLAAVNHSSLGGWIMVAKGCGQCLNFNCTFIVVLMLRRCLTWLRATFVVNFLPLDQNVILHEMVGYTVVILTVVHTAAHIINFINKAINPGLYTFWEYFLTLRPGIGWVYGSASITGILLQLLICLMQVCSSSFVRKGGHFEVFYWTHLSYIWIWILLFLHTPKFWKWFLVPGFLFVMEKVFGMAASRMGGLYIEEVNLLPSKVTHLVVKRPPSFQYKPGDYIYLNIPLIAKYEWHPFTISSAPEQEETLWLHIRSLGQWTNSLYDYFYSPESAKRHNTKRLTQNVKKKKHQSQEHLFSLSGAIANNIDDQIELTSYRPRRSQPVDDICISLEKRESTQGRNGGENHQICNIKCYIDGPFGTPSRRIFTSDHAVLIGAGIGITPFASILQSIMYRYRMRKQNCPNCMYSWCETLKDNDMKLRKVDFIWINRDQKFFEWFVSLLTKLELDQADEEPEGRFLEMHMYMTSALGKNDMKAIGLQMALDLLAKKEERDSITGLKTRTQPGRPDWNKVFQKIEEENKGKVQVFFCGSPALAKVIKAHCEQFNFKFFKENF
ncbi:NADPH oxidase 5-like isoform 2-T4 [Anomaloglossus baeobatrachus]|uniref:NADPH oxidase 5 isoform X1 n=1 Tax=Anomaloglossus baeobatrachus TaxID=238106 RepID=UPI003F4FF080